MKKKLLTAILFAALLLLIYFLFAAIMPYAQAKDLPIDAAALPEPAPGTHRVQLVEAAEDGLQARMHLLEEAREALDISYYAVHMGESTDTVLGGILLAADRGVQVRLLLDGMFARMNRVYAAALASHPNITLKFYNPIRLDRPQTLNARLHDKYILADNKLMLLGGANLGNQYTPPAGYSGAISYDREVLVYNTGWETQAPSVLDQVRAYMDTIWNGSWVEQSAAASPKAEAQAAQLRQLAESFYSTRVPFAGDGDYTALTYPVDRISFLSGDPAPLAKAANLGSQLSRILLTAEESVTLQSPYVILDENIQSFLVELAGKGLDCEILTNSVASSPNPTARAVYAHDRAWLSRQDFRLLEYQGSGSIHAKTYVIDQKRVLIGSFNLDPRSAYIDTELMLDIESPAFAQRVLEAQDVFRAQSLAVQPDGSYGDTPALPPREVSLGKRIVTALLSLPARLVRCLV